MDCGHETFFDPVLIINDLEVVANHNQSTCCETGPTSKSPMIHQNDGTTNYNSLAAIEDQSRAPQRHTLASGARQLVVHEALLITFILWAVGTSSLSAVLSQCEAVLC